MLLKQRKNKSFYFYEGGGVLSDFLNVIFIQASEFKSKLKFCFYFFNIDIKKFILIFVLGTFTLPSTLVKGTL